MKLRKRKTGEIWTCTAKDISDSSDGEDIVIRMQDQEGRWWFKGFSEVIKGFTVYKGTTKK